MVTNPAIRAAWARLNPSAVHPPLRVPDEQDGDARELGVEALRAHLGECLKQLVVVRRLIEQGRGSDEHHVSTGELERAPLHLLQLRRQAPDAASRARGAAHEASRIQRIACRRVSQAGKEDDRGSVPVLPRRQIHENILVLERRPERQNDVMHVGARVQSDVQRPFIEPRSAGDDRRAADRQILQLEPPVGAGPRGSRSAPVPV
jgi:hypothetical protein